MSSGGVRNSTRKRREASRYRFQRYLCTAGEWRFRAVLEELFGEEYEVHYQVRVAALLRPRRSDEWRRVGRRVSQKAFDFVLVRRGTSRAWCAVELDDSSHRAEERVARDHFLDDACRAAGLPLARVPVVQWYVAGEVRAAINEAVRAVTRRRRRKAGYRRRDER